MSTNLPEAWRGIRARRGLRAAGAVLVLALAANLVFAALTLDEGGRQGLHGLAPAFLAQAMALALVPWFTNTARMWIWARFMGGSLGRADAFQITLASDLGAAFTPTAAGSGAVRLAMLLGHGLSAGRASALILLMSLEDAIFFAVVLPLSYFLASGTGGDTVRAVFSRVGERAALVLAAALILGLVVAGIWRLWRGRPASMRKPGSKGWGILGRVLCWLREARAVFAEVLRRGKLRLLATLLLTAVQWVCRYSVVTMVMAAFGLTVFPFADILLQWVVFTAGTFVPTPGGATAVEAAFAVVYQPLIPAALLGPVTAVWRLILFYLVLVVDAAVLAALMLRAGQRNGKRSKRNPASTVPENSVSSSPSA